MFARYARLFGWALGWAVVALAIFLIARPGLPDPIAVHWSMLGEPDGSAPLWAVPAVALAATLVGLALTPIFSVKGEPSMEAFAIVGMSGGLTVAMVAVTASANYGAADWTDAGEMGVGAIAGLFALPVLGLLAGIILGRHWYPLKMISREEGVGDVIEVEPGERVSWIGRARVKGIPVGLFAVAVLLIFFLPEFPLWAFVVVVGLGLVLSQVEAQVTNDGLRVRLGGIPVRKIDLDSVSSARVIDAVPTELGGWGWRVGAGKTAVVLRAGEAIALTFDSGREFVITVDDAATGAALLNGLIDLSRSGE